VWGVLSCVGCFVVCVVTGDTCSLLGGAWYKPLR